MKSKKTFIAIILLFSCFFLNAQEKYQFLIIEHIGGNSEIFSSIDGTDFTVEKVDRAGQEKSRFNANPLLIKVKVWQDKNWELMDFHVTTQANSVEMFYAFLRKKKLDSK